MSDIINFPIKSFADINAKKDCYALAWSYGEICVGCGCCSEDELTRTKARLEYHRECLKSNEEFDNWFDDDPALLTMQKNNIAHNIEYEKKKIEIYEARLKDLVQEGV